MGNSRREILQRTAAFLIASVAASPVLAGEGLPQRIAGIAARPNPGRNVQSYGEIESIDAPHATITILHVPLENPDKSFSMPVMRMVFHVADRSKLVGLKRGDWVSFEAVRVSNAEMVVTNINKIRLEGSRREYELY
jgi:Cu/Ag efflux protein CusF